jgi:hypothetical protein
MKGPCSNSDAQIDHDPLGLYPVQPCDWAVAVLGPYLLASKLEILSLNCGVLGGESPMNKCIFILFPSKPPLGYQADLAVNLPATGI